MPFACVMPEEDRNVTADEVAGWDAVHGDRDTELVCIGIDMDQAAVLQALQASTTPPTEWQRRRR